MRQITAWICTAPDDLAADEHRRLTAVRGACPHLDQLVGHVRTFAVMLTQRTGQRLNDWIRAVQADPQPQLHSFVRGLLADYDAVRAGLTLPHSSGPVEGNVTRIKMIKRGFTAAPGSTCSASSSSSDRDHTIRARASFQATATAS